MGGRSYKLANLFGIRIGVHGSWFLILFLFIFWLYGPVRDTVGGSDTRVYLTTLGLVGGFFGSIVLHEIGHAIAARRAGIEVAGIDLFFFGGIMRMNRDTQSPGVEFKVAAAGPLMTLLIAAATFGIATAISSPAEVRDAATLAERAEPLLVIVSWLATVNAVLLLFNLIPAYPLDGGRIARAAAWKVSGDRERGTRFAARLGQGFSYGLIGLGLVLAFRGTLIDGLWLMALGYLMGQAARAAVQQTAFSEKLRGLTVADIMDAEPVAVPAGMSASQAFEEYFLRYGYDWFAVTENDGRLVGPAHRAAVEHAVDHEGGSMPVRELVSREAQQDGRVAADATLEIVLGSEALRRLGALMAVDEHNRLRGVVTLEQVSRALQARLAPG